MHNYVIIMKEVIETIKRLWFVILMGIMVIALYVLFKIS